MTEQSKKIEELATRDRETGVLSEELWDLVKNFVWKRMRRWNIDHDDITGTGYLITHDTLMKLWKPEKGKFSNALYYAMLSDVTTNHTNHESDSISLKGYQRAELRSLKKLEQEVHNATPEKQLELLAEIQEGREKYPDLIGNTVDTVGESEDGLILKADEEEEPRTQLLRMIIENHGKLSKRERQFILLVYVNGLPKAEAPEAMGLSRQRINQISAAAMTKLIGRPRL